MSSDHLFYYKYFEAFSDQVDETESKIDIECNAKLLMI